MRSSLIIALLLFVVAAAGAGIGIRLTSVPSLSRRLVSFSGGVLLGIVAFWVTPELAVFFGWMGVLLWIAAGFVTLWLIDRYIYPVCPSCSDTHDHHSCSDRLHGFAAPMLLAAGLHSLLDGWTLSASQEGTAAFGRALLIGIAVHKIPEGLALGVIVKSALRSPGKALAGCLAAEFATVAGAAAEIGLAPYLGPAWINGVLALAAGTFLFLGYHAIHDEYSRRGPVPAFIPALAGVAGSSVLRMLAPFR